MIMDDGTKKRVAVVIPIKNEADGLLRLLRILEQQIDTADEVICIDAGSTDDSWEILIRFTQTHPRFKAFKVDGANPGAARNAAIQRTSARFIAQIDGGNIPDANWLPEILKPLLIDKADYVMGAVDVKPVMKSPFGRHVDMGRFFGASLFRNPHLRGRNLNPPAGGASVAYKRQVWHKAGGFPEWLRTGEDRLFAKKIMQQRPRVVLAPDAVILWEIGPDLRHFLKRHHDHQCTRQKEPGTKSGGIRGILLQFCFLTALVAAVLIPWLWPLPVALFGFAVFHQTLKSAKVFYTRGPWPQVPSGLVLLIFLILESLVFPVKIIGTFNRLRRKKNTQHDHDTQTKAYLAS